MEMKDLMKKFPFRGEVVFISVRPERNKPVKIVRTVTALAGKGLEGDRYHSPDGSRQVTLIQGEHLDALASFLRRAEIDPTLTRRNIVVRGLNLLSLKEKKFRIGGALLEHTGECHPCSRMEENLGEGAYNAMRGHGGITARIIESGMITVGDPIYIDESATADE